MYLIIVIFDMYLKNYMITFINMKIIINNTIVQFQKYNI